jgi:signal transduction histidine kinase/DNA-binding response OmpR family regulator/ligand-binding sensor domain-containing protein
MGCCSLWGHWYCFSIWGQTGFERPTIYGVEAGLTDGYITDIVKDDLGFMWIGSYRGLCRFDGTTSRVFLPDAKDPTTLSSKEIMRLYFDAPTQQLWITTTNGFSVMQVRTGTCKRYTHITSGEEKIVLNRMSWVLKDRGNTIWMGGEKGVIGCKPDGKACRLYTYPPSEAGDDMVLHKRIHTMRSALEDLRNDSLLWIGTEAGLLSFNKKTGVFRRFPNSNLIGPNNIRCLYQHNNGDLYYGTYYAGIYRFDPGNHSFYPVHRPPSSKNADSWKNVSKILPKSDTTLWITSFGGLAVLNIQSNTVAVVAENDLLNNRIFGIRYIDEEGRYWNWENEKLKVFNPLCHQFQLFTCPKSISARDFIIQKIIEDTLTGSLFMAAHLSDGLYQLNRRTGQWKCFRPEAASVSADESFHGWDLLRTRQRGEWLVLSRDVLYKLSSNRDKLVKYPLQPQLQEAHYRTMIEDHLGQLWIGSLYNGLVRFNLTDGSKRVFTKELEDPQKIGSWQNVVFVLEDRQRHIWIKHIKGYSVYLPEKDTFHHVFPFGTGRAAHVERFVEDRQGRIWVLGQGEGLGLADPLRPEAGLVRRFTPDNPLKSSVAHRLVVDQRDQIWIGSPEGLECLKSDLKSNTFYPNAYGIWGGIGAMTLLSSGEIVLGHHRSVSIFRPEKLVNNQEKLRPYLTSFKVFQKEYITEEQLPYLQSVSLRHNENYLSIEFSAIGYNMPEQQLFEYELEGIDPGWINPGKRRYVAYTNLHSGAYVFRLRVANNEGVWCEQPLSLYIHIATPWWNTWLAWLGYAALVFGIVFGVYRFQLYRQMEHMENRRLKELDAVKTRLYTNITHEFRTPLTIISGMVEQIRQHPKQWLDDGLDMIARNSQSLLQLVNQMLDLRKLEAGLLPVTNIQGDIVAFIRYLLESFQSYAETKNIELAVESQWERFEMDYDPDKIQSIVSNLLSNALKYTPEGGMVTLKMEEAADKAGIVISVQDSGIGISPEELPLIFDRFHQVNGNAGGAGIGLAFVKELLHLMGGDIQVASTLGQGALFIVTLPVSREASPGPIESRGRDKKYETKPSPAEMAPAAEKAAQQRPLVQIVEDNADVVRYLRACLAPSYQLIVAPNGKAALEQAYAQIPDLVVSDVMMPEMDGFEFCRILKTDERTNHIPVILLTARGDLESRLEGLQRGADSYLSKPFHKEELLIRIKNLLDTRRALQAHYLAVAAASEATTSPEAPVEENAFVLKIRTIVETHLTDSQFDVERLCREAAMSNSNLHRKLSALTGYSANRFIRFIRLSHAKNLLKQPGLTIATVAYDCGFSDPVYFTRAFRQEFGVAPSEWRNGSRGE